MGVEPPFIYDRPSAYSFSAPTDRGFNPRAATQASWTPNAPRTNKKDGPLVELNRHPDSYLIVPYGNLNATPMNPNTKKKVTRARYVQLALRVLELLGTLGMLFCVIAINKTSSSVGWIIRLVPAIALVHTFYAVYHFCRKAAARTAGSTASYMVFAAIIDTGLIPFFVFSALMSHEDYSINAYGWSTLFSTSEISYKIIYAFYLICVVVGGLLIISLVLGVYLALIFRKIAKLPPDMNPLEPTLTARPHKRNKSELTTSEKHLSGATITSDSSIAGTRRVPFMHTRTDSADSLTLYNNSPRQSRLDLGFAKDDPYRRSNLSVTDINLSRPASAINPPENARFAGAGLEKNRKREISPDRASKASSWLSYMDFEGVPTPISEEAEKTLDNEVHYPEPVSSVSSPQGSPKPSREGKSWFARSARNSQVDLSEKMPFAQAYSARNSMVDLTEILTAPSLETTKKRSREPLGMNPPTPTQIFAKELESYGQTQQYQDENISVHDQYFESPQLVQQDTSRQALHDADANSAPRPKHTSRPSSFVGSGGKSRFYGDLRSSIGSFSKDDHKKNDDARESVSDYSRTQTMESDSTFMIHDSDSDDDRLAENNYITYPSRPINNTQSWNGTRQVSNSTGYDLNSGYAGLGAEFGKGMGRRREVSGKIAEEGRSVALTGQDHTAGAAGWARFKGL